MAKEYIEREELITLIDDKQTEGYELCMPMEWKAHYVAGLHKAKQFVEKAPTADVVEVKHGFWKEPKGGGYQCSNCRAFFDDYYGFNAKEKCIYCPICGAKMDLKERK